MIDEQELLNRIETNPGIFAGKPIIRGYRMTVSFLLGMMAAGTTEDELLHNYEWLERDDIRACLLFGSLRAGGEMVEPRVVDREHAAVTR